MEILSDATFRGTTTFKKDVSIDGGNFSVTRSGENSPAINIDICGVSINSGAMINNGVSINGTTNIHGGLSIIYNDESNPSVSANAILENAFYSLVISNNNGGCSFYACGQARINGKLFIDNGIEVNNGAYIRGSLTLCNTCMTAGGKSITFPSKSGTLALTSDIPSVPSVAGFLKSKIIPIDFNVSADCTIFTTAMGTGIEASKVVSLNLFKSEAITFGSTTCGATKQVSADVWAISNGEHFVIEKSSAFAISPSDGYEIRAAYYE